MANISCGTCGGDNLARDPEAAKSDDIAMICLDCGWTGTRTPNLSCRRCASADIDEVGVDGWAYGDADEARENPDADWGYVDKTHYRCRKCQYSWQKTGVFRPYESDANAGEGSTLKVFVDDDVAYRGWLRSSVGYVLNCDWNPHADYLVLHRSSCHTINDLGPNSTTFTEGEYIKVCSTARQAVEQWAVERTRSTPTSCGICI